MPKIMKTTIKFSLIASLFSFATVTSYAAQVDCVKLTFAIKQEVAANHSMVLQIVEKAVLANPSCACEIVKASITETQADAKMIASIVEVAAKAAPEQMRLIAQCAVAVAPDALEDVQAVLAKLDPGAGKPDKRDGAAKPSRSVKAESKQNVLDFPTNGQVVVLHWGGGLAALSILLRFLHPKLPVPISVVNQPHVTDIPDVRNTSFPTIY